MGAFADDANVDPKMTRRHMLGAAAGATLATWSRAAWAADPPKPGMAPPPNAIPPAEALKRLMSGNERYARNEPKERDFSAGRAARAQAQYPFAAILSCADSRVAPELAFDEGPGELFVNRMAGNIVDPDLLASLEYGMQFLRASLILVLGHGGCGAVDAAINVVKVQGGAARSPAPIDTIEPAVVAAEKKGSGDPSTTRSPERRRQVARLNASPPIIQKLYADKKIDIRRRLRPRHRKVTPSDERRRSHRCSRDICSPPKGPTAHAGQRTDPLA